MTAPFVPFTDLLPLRTTADWGEYRELRVIPVCFGDLRKSAVACIPYDAQRLAWVPSDGAVTIDSVQIDEEATDGWEATAEADAADKTITVIRLTAPAPEGAAVTASLQGIQHPDTGALIENPAVVLWYILRHIAGRDIQESVFDRFRNTEIKIAGVLDDNQITIRATLDGIADSIGAVWTDYRWRLYP